MVAHSNYASGIVAVTQGRSPRTRVVCPRPVVSSTSRASPGPKTCFPPSPRPISSWPESTMTNWLRPRDRYLLVEGLRLHVLDWGGDGRTPLLLLHGFTGHAHAWDTLSIALQPHFHVYALDARGHGDSDPADTYTAAAAFDDISGVVDQLGLTSCVLVGLSMGGRNAMYFASQRPERVQKLVVVDIGPEVSARATAPVSGPPEPD